MYRLLIITRKQATEDMFAAMTQADLGDFKPPHFRKDGDGALQCLSQHAIDAVSFDDEDPIFRSYMDTRLPYVPLFKTCGNISEQKEVLRELKSLLLRLRADDYNSTYPTVEKRMEKERTHWIKRVIGGEACTKQGLERKALLYHCPEILTTPCWEATFSIPEDNDFVLERWHYGKNRLEVALRNFFGTSLHDNTIYVVVLSPVEVKLVVVPQKGIQLLSEEELQAYLTSAIKDINQYLELEMILASIQKKHGLADFLLA